MRLPVLSRLFAFLLGASAPLAAHDFYLLPNTFYWTPGATIQIAFNNGDSFPVSELAPSLARLQEARLLFAGGSTRVSGLQTEGKSVVGTVNTPNQQGNFLVTARTAPNLIELPADQFLEYLKEEGLTDVIQWRSQHGESKKAGRERYSKFAKSLLLCGSPSSFYNHIVGFPLEIIPAANPSALHAGDRLPVQVSIQGRPGADLQVEAAWTAGGSSKASMIGRTDAQGRIQIPLSAAGRWRLHTLHMERCPEPSVADWESSWASLTFEIR